MIFVCNNQSVPNCLPVYDNYFERCLVFTSKNGFVTYFKYLEFKTSKHLIAKLVISGHVNHYSLSTHLS